MIRFHFKIDKISDYQRGNLPANATMLEYSKTTDNIFRAVIPIIIVKCVLLNVVMFCKVQVSFHPTMFIGIGIGFLIGLVLIIVHELLHAIVYPKDAEVTVGKVNGGFQFVALASYPLKRSRFILMSLLPYILGLIPFILFVSNVFENPIINGILFGMTCVGMVSPSPDLFNVIHVLKETDQTDHIMFYEDNIYKC